MYQFNVLREHRRLKVEAESVVLTHDLPKPAESPSLAEFDSRTTTWSEEYFDFIAPTGYVPHLPELREFIEAAEETSGGTVIGFAQRPPI